MVSLFFLLCPCQRNTEMPIVFVTAQTKSSMTTISIMASCSIFSAYAKCFSVCLSNTSIEPSEPPPHICCSPNTAMQYSLTAGLISFVSCFFPLQGSATPDCVVFLLSASPIIFFFSSLAKPCPFAPQSINNFAMSLPPVLRAMAKGDRLSQSGLSKSVFSCSVNTRTVSMCPNCVAIYSGDRFEASCALTSAPLSIKTLTSCALPLIAATYMGVLC
mmetsp:Transcript_8195/g.9091  ORF Transcript_8195/g.9091 Transcript_8195/m.9091 type:complete len:217 (+) Transcript_8195:1632-2282(+)